MTAVFVPGKKPTPTLYFVGALVLIGLLVLGAYLAPPTEAPSVTPKAGPTSATPAEEKKTGTPAPEKKTAERKTSADYDDSGPRVPGGGLEAHERAGGHTLARHVGRTEAQLKERLSSEPNISAASSFLDRDMAEAAIAAALAAREADVRRWLAGNDDRLEISNYTHAQPVGISLRRGASAAKKVRSLRVILQRRERAPLGYIVLTAYPQ